MDDYPTTNVISKWVSEWDFGDFDAKTYTHRLHNYPAVFLPQLARKVIEEFSAKGDLVLDIFNGSGTTTLEAMLCGRKSIGIELNPLAILLAHVKSTPISKSDLERVLTKIKSAFEDPNFKYEKSNHKNIDFWYSQSAIELLSKLKTAIDEASPKSIREFFLVSLSKVLREVSFCKHSGFKMHRDKSKLEKPNMNANDLWELFFKKTNENITSMERLNRVLEDSPNTHYPILIQGNSTNPQESIIEKSVDLILTSPPYGDSRTTVAYGQFSRLSSQWLGLDSDENIMKLDNNLMGGSIDGVKIHDEILKRSITLNSAAMAFYHLIESSGDNVTKKKNIKRLKEVISFYIDLEKSIKVNVNYLKDGGYFVLVTASRVVKGIRLNTDQIITELAFHYGLEPKSVFFRNILNKRMPRSVSASNIVGDITPTMTTENIIILKKNI